MDDFMSQVVDLNETEKEEVILFLATALQCGDPHVVDKISKKIAILVMPFLVDTLVKELKKEEEGGENIEKRTIQLGTESKKN